MWRSAVIEMRKGYFYTMDAIVGVLILLVGLIIIAGLYFQAPEKEKTEAIAGDITGLLTSVHVSDVCDIPTCTCRYDSVKEACDGNFISQDMSLMELIGLLYNKNRFRLIEGIVNETIVDQEVLPVNFEMQLIIQDPSAGERPRQIFPLVP
jgi:hypothetical protein